MSKSFRAVSLAELLAERESHIEAQARAADVMQLPDIAAIFRGLSRS